MSKHSEKCVEVPELRLSVHDSIHLIHREDWEAIAKDASLYLQYDHLEALEDAMTGSMDFRYAIFHCPLYRPVGIAYFQILDLEDNGSPYSEQVRKLGKGIGSRIVTELKVRSLVCGNVFHCGEHGVHFINDIPHQQQLRAVEMAMEQFRSDERLKPKVSVLMFKEFWPERHDDVKELRDSRYHQLAMDVNMVMDLDPDWGSLSDYQAALNSKARTRINSIMTRSVALEISDMEPSRIRGSIKALQGLFNEVLARSPFVFGRINVEVYVRWKEVLGDRLMFRAFHLNGELVGFSSAFVMGDTLDVQFVGIKYAYNQSHMIYQRMLVDLLEYAMKIGLRRIIFGRTAEQAKSSIGAEPVHMLYYLKHRNSIANRIIGPFIRSVRPGEFEQRSPFKQVRA